MTEKDTSVKKQNKPVVFGNKLLDESDLVRWCLRYTTAELYGPFEDFLGFFGLCINCYKAAKNELAKDIIEEKKKQDLERLIDVLGPAYRVSLRYEERLSKIAYRQDEEPLLKVDGHWMLAAFYFESCFIHCILKYETLDETLKKKKKK